VILRGHAGDLIAGSERRFVERGHGLCAVTQLDHDGLIGCGGYWEFIESPRFERASSLGPERRGKRLATEACRRRADHAFGLLAFDEVLVSTHVPNAASIRLVDRLGFECTHRAVLGVLDEPREADGPGPPRRHGGGRGALPK
jgi:RimJ/RimL family protein N-acetyltransferase